MGVNIYLVSQDRQTWHPDWHSSRMAGDRELSGIIEQNGGFIEHPVKDPDYPLCRPADIASLEQAEWPDCNPWRWKQLLSILKEELLLPAEPGLHAPGFGSAARPRRVSVFLLTAYTIGV